MNKSNKIKLIIRSSKKKKIKLIIPLNANKVTGHLLHVNSDMILGREYLSMKRESLIDIFGAYV